MRRLAALGPGPWRRRRGPGAPSTGRPSPWLLGAVAVLVALLAIAVIGAVHALRIDHRLQALDRNVEAAQTEAEHGDVQGAQASLLADEAQLASVNSALYRSPDFRLLHLLPIARQNLDAVAASTRLALSVIDDGRTVASTLGGVDSGQGQLHLGDGSGESQALTRLQAEVANILPALPTSPRPPGGSLLLGPIRHDEDRLWSEAYQRRGELTTIDEALRIYNELTGVSGPRSYLVAVANPAEMRGAGGMILSYGVLNSEGGHFSFGAFGNIDQLLLHRAPTRNFPADFSSFFASYKPNILWRNATIMTDFTVDAPVLQSMYTAATGLHVDGVIQLDPEVLSAILAATGPIHDPTLGTITSANVVRVTLNTAYFLFPDRSVRKEFLSAIAKEAFAAATTRPITNLGALISGLNADIKQRHLMMWSSTPGIEPIIRKLGMAGGLPGPGRSFDQLAVESLGADKMDYYVLSGVDVDGTAPDATRPGRVTVTVKLGNIADPAPGYPTLYGPSSPTVHDPPGVYRGFATLYLPAGSTVQSTELGSHLSQAFENFQNGLTAVTWQVVLPAHDQAVATLHVTVPPDPADPGHWTAVPTPRVIPTVTQVHLTPQRNGPRPAQGQNRR